MLVDRFLCEESVGRKMKMTSRYGPKGVANSLHEQQKIHPSLRIMRHSVFIVSFASSVSLCCCLNVSPPQRKVETNSASSRRDFLQLVNVAAPLMTGAAVLVQQQPANAATHSTGPEDGNLPDLPPEAVRSYLQYRIPLQTSADFYVFELQDLLQDISQWGEVGELFQVNNNRGQGNPSRIEREFTNVFRIVGLSMPPETADEMREAQFRFEKAAATISKVTAGIRRDLPIEVDKNAVPMALASWEDGRKAINSFFVSLNDATGLSEMKTIPPAGPEQAAQYGRSKRRYVDLKKKIKLCQNRGGPTLSQAWGQLMVSGYMQDSCGIPDLDEYFYQT
jgi:hypothetical protein